MQHTHLSEDELVAQLASLCLDGKRLVARVIEHLIAIEDRDIHLRAACDTMWAFCVTRMNMSEGEASRRLTAVGLVRRFPSLLGRIARGEVHLSALKLAAKHLDESNADRILDAMKHKTKTEVRELLAAMFPRPDAPSLELEVTGALSTGDGKSFIDPTTGKKIVSKIEPLSQNGFYVQLTMTREGYETYQRAKQLMSHRIPDGDTVKIFETALTVLVDKLEKERLGKTTRPQKKRRPSKPGHIAAETRREVFERDGFQCTYVDAHGRRCQCKKRLELDHIVPRARGGSDEASNLRVRCRPHNKLWAEEVFGKEHVARAIENRRAESKAPKDAEPSHIPGPLVEPVPDAVSHIELAAPDVQPPASVISLATIDQTTRGLLSMGFAKAEVTKTVDALVRRHRGEAKPATVPDLIREAIGALT